MSPPLLPSPLSFLAAGVSIVDAIRTTDAVGYLCLGLLAAISVVSGYYMFAKLASIRAASAESKDFIAECHESHKSLRDAYKSTKHYPNSPLAALLREAYLEYESEIAANSKTPLSLDQRLRVGRLSVESALERTIAAEMRRLESKLIWLATSATLAPFIGLFGTVWGVLGVFQAAANEGSAGLATIAPGISTALVTTVFGLLVAIPASAMYNWLTSQVNYLASQMDSFAHELSNVFQRQLLRRD
ncbi:MAG: MotA/TolQ/ExbB proton channel family protein [Sumerlaeia bacterium]